MSKRERPARIAKAAASNSTAAISSLPPAPRPRSPSCRVLLADDKARQADARNARQEALRHADATTRRRSSLRLGP